MAYFYVLTFFGDKRAEYWFRKSAVEIVDCIEDFMYPEDEYDENMIAISLEQLNVAGGKEIMMICNSTNFFMKILPISRKFKS